MTIATFEQSVMPDLESYNKRSTHKLVHYDTGEVIYKDFTFDEHFEVMFSDGAANHWLVIVDGETYYDHGIVRAKSHQHAGNYPMASYAMGGGACEVPAMMKVDREGGVPTEYTTGPDGGDPIFTSRGHRKRYLKLHGYHDRNSFDGN
jgi:hypothetical protein